jgi:hypothetical protein
MAKIGTSLFQNQFNKAIEKLVVPRLTDLDSNK